MTDQERVLVERLMNAALQATTGWACFARSKRERDWIARLHLEIRAVAAALPDTSPVPTERHVCAGCGYRWAHPVPSPVELCGDCWRKVWPILKAAPGEPREAVRVLEEIRDLIGMHLSHFLALPEENTRRETIDCVEYLPLRQFIETRLDALRAAGEGGKA